MSAPRALLFDVGNVVVELDFARALRRWAELAGVEPGALAQRFSLGAEHERFERGEIDAAAFCEALRAALGLGLDDEALLAGWNEIFIRPAPGIASLLERAASRLPLYAFSNTDESHHGAWEGRFGPLLEPFTEVFVSYRLGHRKPELEAYLAVAAAIGLDPAEILFFDDGPANVAGARAAGMSAVLVGSTEDVRRALEPLLDGGATRGGDSG